jgi:hypothetical protein
MTPQQATNIQRMINNQDNLLTQINNVVVYDAQGDIFTALHETFTGPRKGSDRSFFIYHKENKISRFLLVSRVAEPMANGSLPLVVALKPHRGI